MTYHERSSGIKFRIWTRKYANDYAEDQSITCYVLYRTLQTWTTVLWVFSFMRHNWV